MSKIKLVISTEYKQRVMKKSFILLTLLMPILFAAIIFVPLWLSKNGTETQSIMIVDNDGRFFNVWDDSKDYDIKIDIVDDIPEETVIDLLNEVEYSAAIIINPVDLDMASISILSNKTTPNSVVKYIEKRVSETITNERLSKIASQELITQIDNAKCQVKAKTIKYNDHGEIEKGAEAEVAVIIGIIATMLIYMFIFISGAQVMNAVVQEKTNRIVEVMLSAIKPWELMWGKLIAVALVCLTQILIWGIFTLILIVGIGFTTIVSTPELSSSITDTMSMQYNSMAFPDELSMLTGINWGFIVFWFIAYFIAGYLLYAAIFAAVGAAVDNEADTQQFLLPITAIVLFAFYTGIYSAENPDGALAFWCSIIPFTSPIVMMVRIPFGVAWWELALSFSLLITSVFGVAWLCSKIYRVGILMYGKKASWKELWKWIKY